MAARLRSVGQPTRSLAWTGSKGGRGWSGGRTRSRSWASSRWPGGSTRPTPAYTGADVCRCRGHFTFLRELDPVFTLRFADDHTTTVTLHAGKDSRHFTLDDQDPLS